MTPRIRLLQDLPGYRAAFHTKDELQVRVSRVEGFDSRPATCVSVDQCFLVISAWQFFAGVRRLHSCHFGSGRLDQVAVCCCLTIRTCGVSYTDRRPHRRNRGCRYDSMTRKSFRGRSSRSAGHVVAHRQRATIADLCVDWPEIKDVADDRAFRLDAGGCQMCCADQGAQSLQCAPAS